MAAAGREAHRRIGRVPAADREGDQDLIARRAVQGRLGTRRLGRAQGQPGNKRLLYQSAVAAAVMRDQRRPGRPSRSTFAPAGLDCADARDVEQTLFELYRGQARRARSSRRRQHAELDERRALRPGRGVLRSPERQVSSPASRFRRCSRGTRLTSTDSAGTASWSSSITTSVNPRAGRAAVDGTDPARDRAGVPARSTST